MKKWMTCALVLGMGCGATGAEPEAASGEETAEASPVTETAPLASPLGVSLPEVDEAALRAALSGEEWDVRSVSSSGDNLNLVAFRGEARVGIGLGRPLHPMRISSLESEGTPMHAEGEDILYVEFEGDPAQGQAVLDALLGR